MGKYLKMLGYLILLFLVISNCININLPDAIIVSLGVLSAILMCAGIYISDADKAKKVAVINHLPQKHPHETDVKTFTTISGRGDLTRTGDLSVPNAARYQLCYAPV